MEQDEQPDVEAGAPTGERAGLSVGLSPFGVVIQATRGEEAIAVTMPPDEAIKFAGLIQSHATIHIMNQFAERQAQAEEEEELRRRIFTPPGIQR